MNFKRITAALALLLVIITLFSSCTPQFEDTPFVTQDPENRVEYTGYKKFEGEVDEDGDPVFISDLSEYEKYMDPEDRDAYLICVNSKNPLSADYEPDDLVEIRYTFNDEIMELREYAARALEAFIIESEANGYKKLSVYSAYRSYSYQEKNYEDAIMYYRTLGYPAEDAEKQARLQTPPAGESEYQTGLVVKIHNFGSVKSETVDKYFGSFNEAKWLAANAWRFGFILRYPKDKEDYADFSNKPATFRYVGRYHAKRITELGMCLEEYLEYLAAEHPEELPDSSEITDTEEPVPDTETVTTEKTAG